LAAKVDNFQAAPVDDLTQELTMLRALTDDYLSRFEDGVTLTAGDIHILRDLLEDNDREAAINDLRSSLGITESARS
jgi:hypothetical protein